MDGVVGFNPIRIDEGAEYSLIVGSDGQVVKINQKGVEEGPSMCPFPGASSCGIVSSDRWVGSWVDRNMRKAFMGSFPLDEIWHSIGTESEGLDNVDVNQSVSKSASWVRELQSEPVAMCAVEENIVFAGLGSGIYMIDKNASEIWRSPYPRWRELEDLVGVDSIVSLIRRGGEIYAFSSSGGYSIISITNGHEINNGILSNLPERIHGVRFNQDSGWMIMLRGKNFAVLEDLLSEPMIFKVPGPVLDAHPHEGGWIWTGWRHDGHLSSGSIDTFARSEIGISLLRDRVLTNSGSWSVFYGRGRPPEMNTGR
jgi:hypothetical protein